MIKEYYISENIGKAKYVINFFDNKFYKDGSKFFDIKVFSNKKKLNKFIKKLLKI